MLCSKGNQVMIERIPITKLDGCISWKKPQKMGETTLVKKDSGYVYSSVKVLLTETDMQVVFSGHRVKYMYLTIKDFKQFDAVSIINKLPQLGRHFEDAILGTYHSLGLPLGYTEPILKNM